MIIVKLSGDQQWQFPYNVSDITIRQLNADLYLPP
jgi:hypothetical protein